MSFRNGRFGVIFVEMKCGFPSAARACKHGAFDSGCSHLSPARSHCRCFAAVDPIQRRVDLQFRV